MPKSSIATDADFLQPGELFGRLDVLDHKRLGDFQTQRTAIEAELVNNVGDRLDETIGNQPTAT